MLSFFDAGIELKGKAEAVVVVAERGREVVPIRNTTDRSAVSPAATP